MVETQLKEVERFKVGYANDWVGATHKYLILDETKRGKYRIRLFVVLNDVDDQPYLLETSMEMRDKSEVKDIHEETLA